VKKPRWGRKTVNPTCDLLTGRIFLLKAPLCKGGYIYNFESALARIAHGVSRTSRVSLEKAYAVAAVFNKVSVSLEHAVSRVALGNENVLIAAA